jgi:hypothetical protein
MSALGISDIAAPIAAPALVADKTYQQLIILREATRSLRLFPGQSKISGNIVFATTLAVRQVLRS